MTNQPASDGSPGDSLGRPPYSDLHHEDRYITSFYGQAEYHNVVARQNYSPSLDWFVLSCYREYGDGVPGSGLELACGPALHSITFASQGIEMTAMDYSASTVEVARRNVREAGAAVEVHQGNFITYRTPEPVDFAMNLGLNTSYILSNEEMLSHLDAVADCLVIGGVYLLDVEFLVYRSVLSLQDVEPPWLIYRTEPPYIAHGFRGDLKISIQYGHTVTYYDPIRQLFKSKDFIRLSRNGRVEEVIETESVGKVYFPLELLALVEQTGRFEFMSWHHDYRLSATFDGHPEADRFILVLRRR